MRRKTPLLALLAICFLFPLPAAASPLIADLSIYTIDIDSSFSGTRLYVFGARNGSGNIVAVLRGGSRNYLVRRKEKIAGFWVNRERHRLFGMPNFYASASSLKQEDGDSARLFSQLGIGLGNLLPKESGKPDEAQDFDTAFLRNRQNERLYLEQPGSVRFLGETLFKAALDLPDNVPIGDYTAEVYLISDGQVVGMQSTPLHIGKIGLDAALANMAHQSPALYGLFAVSLAVLAGWLTGRIFEKI